ncbi:hypothetical protein BDV95DRAFT_382373 [Massariosphaeria phaeospora]|uniref:Uncharacterized protein n=1 Tax=Massariosphaeria phaeospora TaxID=100035 RepID=A0A7C8MD35_9PLEO|nr:hypothetical protein BDV95DRAFT_382373 [Massariosphaeria phaeospora]
MPELKYTVRPWVRTGLSLTMPVLGSSGLLSTPISTDATAVTRSSTIRLVGTTPATESLRSMQTPNHSSSTLARDTPTPKAASRFNHPSPTLDPPEQPRAAKLNTLSMRDKPSPKTPPNARPRGKTVPLAGSKTHTPERDTDSVLSFTPSTSSKHIANWFSGLLGR